MNRTLAQYYRATAAKLAAMVIALRAKADKLDPPDPGLSGGPDPVR